MSNRRAQKLEFAPPNIRGLVGWFAADRLALVHGDKVAVWPDLSGRGNHALQDTDAKRPVLYNNTEGQHAVVYFDGSDDELLTTLGATTGNASHTLFAASRQINLSYNVGLVTFGTTGAGYSTSTIGNIVNLWYGGQNTVAPTGSVLPSVFNVLSKTFDGTTIQGYLNGASDASGSRTYAIGDTCLALGIFVANWLTVRAYLGEVIFYDRFLEDSERKLVEQYLGRRWNVTVTP